MQTKNMTLQVQNNSILRPLKVQNLQKLVSRSKKVGAKLGAFNGSEKEDRRIRTRLNKAIRQLNDQRKANAKPLKNLTKNFKSQIDQIIKPLKIASNMKKKQLKIYKQGRQKKIKLYLKPEMHEICQSRHISDQPIPSNALKLSLSHSKRLDILVGTADYHLDQIKKQNIYYIHGKTVNVKTGEIMTHIKARNLTFVGDNEDYKQLMKFAKDNGICLK